MAETNSPPPEALEEIALQIRRRLVVEDDDHHLIFSFRALNDRGSPATSTLDLGETFELWVLTPAAVDQFEARGGDLARLARPTGRWHHQVRLDNNVSAFARSGHSQGGGEEAEGWAVDEIYVTPLAERLDAAIEVAEAEFPGDDLLARLLTAPAYQVEALWFVDRDEAGRGAETGGELLIVTAPAANPRLRALQRLGAAELLEALRGARVGMGINPVRPGTPRRPSGV